jgi:hypothetical protein
VQVARKRRPNMRRYLLKSSNVVLEPRSLHCQRVPNDAPFPMFKVAVL